MTARLKTYHTSIPAYLIRHAGDAAFYWTQRDTSAHSPLIGLEQLAQFDQLLLSHLDGLRIAGAAGWDTALRELGRWQGAGEAFVCTLLAIESPSDGTRLSAIWQILVRDPERMMRGCVSAFAWSEQRHAQPWIDHWLNDERTPALLQAVAWRAAGLLAAPMKLAIKVKERALASSSADVRAAACRTLGQSNEDSLDVAHLLADIERSVRAEAAIAQSSALPAQRLSVLWQTVAERAREYAALTGRSRHDTQRQLNRWIRHLGLMTPSGHGGIANLLAELPPRQALLFALHHGDGALLPWVKSYLNHPEVARLAGWVWSTLTGIDLEHDGLSLPPRMLDGDPRPTDDLDPGLPEPNTERILAYPTPILTGSPVLLGTSISAACLPALLQSAPQALRWIASQRFRDGAQPRINIRSAARKQLSQLNGATDARSIT